MFSKLTFYSKLIVFISKIASAVVYEPEKRAKQRLQLSIIIILYRRARLCSGSGVGGEEERDSAHGCVSGNFN
jgi:hypothetical protein